MLGHEYAGDKPESELGPKIIQTLNEFALVEAGVKGAGRLAQTPFSGVCGLRASQLSGTQGSVLRQARKSLDKLCLA